jgi:hypothetical protein
MRRSWMLAAPFLVIAALLPAQPASGRQKWFDKAVKKIEASFDPAEAKPGQTVTFKLTIDLNEGYHTYPTVQPEKAAENFVNTIKYPSAGSVIFVGTTTDPKKFEEKAEPALQIEKLRYMSGSVVFTRRAVVSPKAAPGPIEVKLDEFRIQVCDKNVCYPSKKVDVMSAKLKVLDGPAVPVDKEYADEVMKAMK